MKFPVSTTESYEISAGPCNDHFATKIASVIKKEKKKYLTIYMYKNKKVQIYYRAIAETWEDWERVGLFKKLRYSNERWTKFESLYHE